MFKSFPKDEIASMVDVQRETNVLENLNISLDDSHELLEYRVKGSGLIACNIH